MSSRTDNSIRNVKSGMIVQLINKLMAFLVRTVFIQCLNTEYLGINGLFTNILTILSFAELGIGTAIIFNMYKPVAIDDREKIKSLMHIYKIAYNTIGIIVFVLGLFVIPFMDYIVKDTPNISENIIFIYLLFLFNTSVSYFFTYKKSIIYANQQQSIINNINGLFYILKSFVEIIILFLTKNFILYLLIQISFTIIENVVISSKVNKLYPYLKDKNVNKLAKKEKNKIFSNVKSLIIYQFGSVIMNGTDNILISSLVNVSAVGLCSNYTLIINSVKSVVSTALNGVMASVGNLNAIGTKERKEEIFYQLTFIDYLIYSFCAIAFICLLNPFISFWVGDNYLLNFSISVALSISFFIDGMRNPGYIYRTTLGLFEKSKVTPYIGAITNLVLSIILCKFLGLVGIFIATSIAQLVSYSWIDPYLIHKYEFGTSSKKYFKYYVKYFIIFIINIMITLCIIKLIKINGLIGLIIKFMVVAVLPNILNIIFLFKTYEFRFLLNKFVKPILLRFGIKIKKF